MILLLNIFLQYLLVNVNASEIYHNNELKKYFVDLKNSKNLDEAIVIEKNIWNLWNLHPKNQLLTNKLELGWTVFRCFWRSKNQTSD